MIPRKRAANYPRITVAFHVGAILTGNPNGVILAKFREWQRNSQLSTFNSLMTDNNTTVLALRELVERFVTERDWHTFHSPKNLTMALAIEVAELMEHFQWLTTEASREVRNDPQELEAVGEELADVICYALAIANELSIDVTTAMRKKMVKNEAKYPVSRYRGRYE